MKQPPLSTDAKIAHKSLHLAIEKTPCIWYNAQGKRICESSYLTNDESDIGV